MNAKRWTIVLLALAMSMVMSGCGTYTFYYGQTATPSLTPTRTATALPTSTSTPTPIPSPTLTPTLAAPATSTPVPVQAGWRGYTASGFYLALPQSWEAIDIDKAGIQAVLDALKGLDNELARNATKSFSAEQMKNLMKFWAFDKKPAGVGLASVNVIFQTSPFSLDSTVYCAQIPAAYKQLGIELVDSKCGMDINGLDAARFIGRLQTGVMAVKEYQYIFIQERNTWVLTLAVEEGKWAEYQPIFDAIAQSFRVDQQGVTGVLESIALN
jgi:hypothetical protein